MGNMGMGFPANGMEDQGWKLYIASVVMVTAAGLFVIARCTSRFYFFKFGWDDILIVLSLISSIIVSVAVQLAIENGYGMHKKDLSTAQRRQALKFFFIAQTPYKVTVCLNKVAVILFYMRIFITPKFRMACYIVMGFVVCWSVGAIAATIFQCVPIAGCWDKSVPAKCIDSDAFWIAYAVMNILTDVMVLALPIQPILSLQLGTRQKLMLCGTFLMGSFVIITSILRTTAVQNSLHNQQDTTWNFIDRGIWTLIEANAGIISACLPILKQPMARLFPRIFGSTMKDSAYYGDNSRSKGAFNLSNMSGQKPNLWRGAEESSRNDVSIVTPESSTDSRKSDEQHIINEISKDHDNGSYVQDVGRILRRIEVKTSYHEAET